MIKYNSGNFSVCDWLLNRRCDSWVDCFNRNGIFRDVPGFVYRLKLDRCHEAHDGCVNSICWNQKGNLILSGSDDLMLKITNPFESKLITTVQSGHRSNILSAKFLPYSDDAKIVSCSGDGQIIFTEVHRPESYGKSRLTCHSRTTPMVEVIDNDPFSFLSCGQDGTVRHFDIRNKISCNKSFCKHDVLYKTSCGVSAISINQMVPHQMAVCCTDGIVRLMDRRFMIPSNSNRNLKSAFLKFSPHTSNSQLEDGERVVNRRITSVKFCPNWGNEVLVNYSGDSLYLFSLHQTSSSNDNYEEEDVETHKLKKCPAVFSCQNNSSQVSTNSSKSFASQCPSFEQTGRNVRETESSAVGDHLSIFRRLRIRGDWSDTGPKARPVALVTTSTTPEQSGSAAEMTPSSYASDATAVSNNIETETTELDRSPILTTTTNESHTIETSHETDSPSVRRPNMALLTTIITQMLERRFAAAIESEQTDDSSGNPIASSSLVTATTQSHQTVEPQTPSETDATDSIVDSRLSSNSSVWPSDCNNTDRTANAQMIVGEEVESSSFSHAQASESPSSCEEERQRYIQQVHEEVRSASLIDDQDSLCNKDGCFSGMVFVREQTPNNVGTSQLCDSSGIQVYIEQPSESNDAVDSVNQHSEGESNNQFDQDSVTVSNNLATNLSHSSSDGNAAVANGDPLPVEGPAMNPSKISSQAHLDNNSEESVHSIPSSSDNVTESGNNRPPRSTRQIKQRWGTVVNNIIRARHNRINREGTDVSNRTGAEATLKQSRPRIYNNVDGEDCYDSEDNDEQHKKDSETSGLFKVPNADVKVKCSGHRNTRTSIKQANFWGEDYVVTGSDCGHVFFYERKSGKLVTILEADNHVVNCVQPHPYTCALATSGIDYNIKLWMPTGPPGLGAPPHMMELVERNNVMQRQTQGLITVPASFMLRLLAAASAREGGVDDSRHQNNDHTANSTNQRRRGETELDTDTSDDSEEEQ